MYTICCDIIWNVYQDFQLKLLSPPLTICQFWSFNFPLTLQCPSKISEGSDERDSEESSGTISARKLVTILGNYNFY